MAAANASARGQRVAILASRLTEFSGYYVAVDCQSGGMRRRADVRRVGPGEFYRGQTVGHVLQRMRCNGLWRARGRRVAGDRPGARRPGQAAPGGAARAGGAGVAQPADGGQLGQRVASVRAPR